MVLMKRWTMWLLLAGCLTLASCVSDPVLSLHSARITQVMPTGVNLDIMMKVKNKNAFDVQVRNVNVVVKLADKYTMPRINYSPNQWLPAYQSTLVRVPVIIPWQLIRPLLSLSVDSETIEYTMVGTADVTAVRMLGIRRNDHEIDDEGEVSRSQVLMAAARSIGIGR